MDVGAVCALGVRRMGRLREASAKSRRRTDPRLREAPAEKREGIGPLTAAGAAPTIPEMMSRIGTWPVSQEHLVSAHRISAISVLLALSCFSAPSHAGVYGDSFGKCLVSTSTDQDKHKLVEWIFASIALNPSVSSYVSLPAEKRQEIDRNMAAVFERLVGESCRKEAVEAVKYEGPAAFAVAFQLFGQVAGQQMFAAPEVSKGSEAFLEFLDVEGLQRKIGIPPGKH